MLRRRLRNDRARSGNADIAVEGDRDHPVSGGYTCKKGRAIPQLHHSPDRVSYPRIRGEVAGWDECLDDIAAVMRRQMAECGPDAIAHYVATAAYYDSIGWLSEQDLFGKIGSQQRYTSITVDVAPMFRAAELVTGFWSVFPTWAPEDDGPSLAIFLGFNPSVSHGYLGASLANPTQRIRRFQERGGVLWVIDARRTKTASLADRFIGVRPGSDVFLLGWLVSELLRDGFDASELASSCDTEDIDRLWTALEPFDTVRVSDRTGSGRNAGVGGCHSPTRKDCHIDWHRDRIRPTRNTGGMVALGIAHHHGIA
jgi:anaerobic selenocysteine-containing dehydrogenase